jgi:hypothetical protein
MSTLNVEAISHPTPGSNVTINGTTPAGTNQLGNRNKIINGDMRIDQRNAGAGVTSSTAYPVDRWINYGATDGTYTGQQSTDVPTGQGFSNSLKYTVTTADATIGATQYASIGQRIEGYNTADLMLGTANAKQFTVSFWVKSSVAGTYGFALQNTAGDRGYATTYSIASTDTWEYKTLVITGDTTGTWLSDNSIGLRATWGLGIGSTYTVSANNTWEAGIKFGAVGATNLMATLNATFYITGVQLEVGEVATPFEHRSYGDELARCERYYQVIKGGAGAFTSNAAFIAMNFSPMRATPTFTADGVLRFTDVIQADYTQSSAQLVVGNATDRNGVTDAQNLSTTSGRVAIFIPNNGNYINASAEL